MEKCKISNLKASAAWQVDFSTAPNDFEYMPAGEHKISCSVNGNPREIKIVCDESTAEIFQRSLDAVNAAYDRGEMSRPFIDFDHEGGEAAAFPKRFFWRDGLRLEVEWTEAGRRAVEEKRYNYCSPQFFFERDTGALCGVAYPGSIGALVNVPAFQSIQKISAKLSQTKDTDMSDDKDKQPAADKTAELEKQLKAKDDEIAALKAQLENDKKDDELEALKGKIAALEQAKKDAEDKAACARKNAIEAKVEELVKCGRIKADAKGEVVAAALKTDDDGAKLLESYPEVTDAPIAFDKGSAKKTDGTLGGLELAAAAFNKQFKK